MGRAARIFLNGSPDLAARGRTPRVQGELETRGEPSAGEPVKRNKARFSFSLKSGASVVFLVYLADCPPEGMSDRDGPSPLEAM